MEEAKNLTGIVLQSYDVRDSSRMVDLFTLEEGRLSFLARGAKRNKSRFLNLTEPYMEGQFHLLAGRNLFYLKEGSITAPHFGLRASIRRMTAARFCTELLSHVLVDGTDAELFQLYQAFLAAVEEAPDERLSHGVAAFLFKLVSYAGFRPTLGSCILCGKPVRSGDVFSMEEGGMRCAEHGMTGDAQVVSLEQYRALTAYMRLPLRDIMTTYDFGEADGLEMARFTFRYYGLHTGRRTSASLHLMQRLHLI